MSTVNFRTIHGVDQWVAAFPEQLRPLSPAQRAALVEALTLGVHEGWEPTDDDIRVLAQQVAGQRPELTAEECLEAAQRISEL